MILIFLKNLQNRKNQSEKEKKTLILKMQLYLEGKKILMLLNVKYFQKENKEKDFQIFWIMQLGPRTINSPKY